MDKYQSHLFFSKDSMSNFVINESRNGKLSIDLQVYPDGKMYEISFIRINVSINDRINRYLHLSSTELFKKGFDQFENEKAEIVSETILGEP